jgi:hypothetical protein
MMDMYEVCKTFYSSSNLLRASTSTTREAAENNGLADANSVERKAPTQQSDAAGSGPERNQTDAKLTQGIRERIFARNPRLRERFERELSGCLDPCLTDPPAHRHPNQFTRDPRAEVQIVGRKAFVQLTRDAVAIIDAEDAERVGRYLWRAKRSDHRQYAYGAVGTMHRYILQPPAGAVVDHIDGDGLNNRKENLRICSSAENIRNARKYTRVDARPRSQFRGVTKLTGRDDWRAQIMAHGVKINLGSYPTQELAARAYDMAARHHFGEFARPNFAEDEDGGSR